MKISCNIEILKKSASKNRDILEERESGGFLKDGECAKDTL